MPKLKDGVYRDKEGDDVVVVDMAGIPFFRGLGIQVWKDKDFYSYVGFDLSDDHTFNKIFDTDTPEMIYDGEENV